MLRHVTDEVLLDLVEGNADGEARRHVEECMACRARVEQATAGWHAARDAEVPEPSPLYWEVFRRQVGRHIEASDPKAWRPLALVPILAAAAIMAAVTVIVPGSGGRGIDEPNETVPAWFALPSSENDDGLAVLAGVAPQAGVELTTTTQCHDVGHCLATLSEEESEALAAALRGDLEKGGTL